MEKIRTILKSQISLLTFILLFISLNSFSANVKFYNISDIYGITSGEAFSVWKDQYGFIWARYYWKIRSLRSITLDTTYYLKTARPTPAFASPKSIFLVFSARVQSIRNGERIMGHILMWLR